MIFTCEYCARETSQGPVGSTRFDELVWPACCSQCEMVGVWRPVHRDNVDALTRGLAAAATPETRRRASVADEAFYLEMVRRVRPPVRGTN